MSLAIILKTYDLTQQLREAEVTVIGGFHSLMEQECLTILLRGNQPLIVCPARTLKNMRLPSAFKKPLDQGRLLVLSPFSQKERRHTVELASRRNRLVGALATAIFVSRGGNRSIPTGQISMQIFSQWALCLWIPCLLSDLFDTQHSLIAEPPMQVIAFASGMENEYGVG